MLVLNIQVIFFFFFFFILILFLKKDDFRATLTPLFNYDEVKRRVAKDQLNSNQLPPGMWRYKAFLPIHVKNKKIIKKKKIIFNFYNFVVATCLL